MKTCVLSLTAGGAALARRIAASLAGCAVIEKEQKIADTLREAWSEFEGIICIMAAGIVVRAIAPLLSDKTTDPGVVVVDQQGRFAVSLLSGHLGGGNELAVKVAAICGGQPVITTASDVLGRTALDLWAKRNNLVVTDRSRLTEKSAKLVNEGVLTVFSDAPLPGLPADLIACSSADTADIVISCNKCMTSPALWCIPEVLYLGIGCNRGTAAEDIERSLVELCQQFRLDRRAIAGIATIDIKSDEEGMLLFARQLGISIRYHSRDELNAVENVSCSPAAMKAVGVQGVAEPAALLAARQGGFAAELVIAKRKWKDVTLAVAERKKDSWA